MNSCSANLCKYLKTTLFCNCNTANEYNERYRDLLQNPHIDVQRRDKASGIWDLIVAIANTYVLDGLRHEFGDDVARRFADKFCVVENSVEI
jgi:hypothetical protein